MRWGKFKGAALLLLLFAQPSHALDAPIKPNMKAQLAVPPVWDPINRTFYVPEMISVQQASSLENCSFYGGQVIVKKVTDDLVYFDKVSKSKPLDFCDRMVTSKENFRGWNIYVVEEQKLHYSRASSAFRQQLNSDVKGILDQKDNCEPKDNDLKIGSFFKLEGDVFWHGTNTAAMTTADSDTCHVEKNGIVEVLGFDRTSDFALVSYRKPEPLVESVEVVDIQLKHKMRRTCKNGEKVVLPLKKVRSQFQLTSARNPNGLISKLAGMFHFGGPKVKICAAGTP
jgi:hypothetical protein